MNGLSHEAYELVLYIDNDSHMYNRKKSFLANVKRKKERGTYKSSLAPKLWIYYATEGAKRYGKENMSSQAQALRIFSPKVRREVAEHYAREAESELR